jgi:hypothetical protein
MASDAKESTGTAPAAKRSRFLDIGPLWISAIGTLLAAIIAGVGLFISNSGGNRPASPSPTQASHSARPTSQTLGPTTTPSSGRTTATLTASIREPTPGAMVPLCQSVSGLASHVPSTMALWLFIQIPDQNDRPARWYVVAKLKPDSGGRWLVPPFQVGDPGPGRPYWLEIFGSNISVTGPITAADLGNDALGSIPLGFNSRPLTTVLIHREDTSTSATCP